MIPALVPGNRHSAIERWWQQLDDRDRRRARVLSVTDDRLPTDLFLGLCDAGVLVVENVDRILSSDVGARTFPMPADIRAYVQTAPADQASRWEQSDRTRPRAAS